jgi:hypothetical protein
MARSKKPYCFTNIVRKAWDRNQIESHETKEFPTYKELKKNLVDLLKASEEGIVTIYRTRRGEWGEWFEKWGLVDDKPVLLKEGWM